MAFDAGQIDDLTTDEIKSIIKAGEDALRRRDETSRKELWDKIKLQIEEAGHSVEHVFEWGMTQTKAIVKGSAPIKYRGPQGETWSGRGKPPRWLSTLENAGHNRIEFLINKAPSDPEASEEAQPASEDGDDVAKTSETHTSNDADTPAQGRKGGRRKTG